MLLKLRNGTVWFLTDAPDKQYIDALKSSRLQPSWLWIGVPALLAILFLVLAAMISTQDSTGDSHVLVTMMAGVGCVLVPSAIIAPYIGYAIPVARQETLDRILRGNVESIVPETSMAFQLIKPIIVARSDDPELQQAVQDYFLAIRGQKGDGHWWREEDLFSPEVAVFVRRKLANAARTVIEQHPSVAVLMFLHLVGFVNKAIEATRALDASLDADRERIDEKRHKNAATRDDLQSFLQQYGAQVHS